MIEVETLLWNIEWLPDAEAACAFAATTARAGGVKEVPLNDEGAGDIFWERQFSKDLWEESGMMQLVIKSVLYMSEGRSMTIFR